MNNREIVSALQYLLETRQAELLKQANVKNITKNKESELLDEAKEVECYVEMTREGYTE